MLIDMVVYLPAIAVGTWASLHSQAMALLLEIPLTFALIFYNVYFIGRWGQTLGKMALRIKVVSLDGTDAGYRRALRRHGVDLVLSLISTVIQVHTFLSFSASDYDGLTDRQKVELYESHLPAWADEFTLLSYVWVASELIVLLLNKKRRALHDYLAGTMVIHVGRTPVGERQA